MSGRIGFEFQFGQSRAAQRAREEGPMRILLMADFSGRGHSGVQGSVGLDCRPILSVDVDNFDRILARVAPSVHLPDEDAAAGAAITFSQLDDFHPDRLFSDLKVFEALRATRAQLRDPATFAAAATAVRSAAEDDSRTLERLLGGKPGAPTPDPSLPAGKAAGIERLIRTIVAPHIVPDAPPHQAQYLASVDAAIAEQMGLILHHPSFQALEAAWRGVRWLISELEVGEDLQLHLLDVSPGELRADMEAAGGNPAQSGLYRRLVQQGGEVPGGEPWSLLAADCMFGMTHADIDLLAYLGAIASQAGGPFVAAAGPGFLACDSVVATPDPRDWQPVDAGIGKHWQALRESAIAPWLGLAMPRVLMRLPYGKRTDPVEQLAFEEHPPGAQHETLLWGSPAFACALLVGRSFLANGWDMVPGDERDIGDLPAFVRDIGGEKQLQACAEAYLGERAGEAMLARGLMPFISVGNRNAARLLRLQSLADPVKPLAGPWR
jgi:type VI secretion system protein ImpC